MSSKSARPFAITKKGKAFWGDPVWKTLHIFGATLKPGNGHALEMLIEQCLPLLLPCDECCKNLRIKLKILPPGPYMSNNHDAFFYTYVLRDMVNEQINEAHPELPPKVSPNYDDFKAYIFGSLQQECKECSVAV